VDLAIEDVTATGSVIDKGLLIRTNKDDEAGWIKTPARSKVLKFVTTLRRSDRLFNAFKRAAGKTIRALNKTR
jgi:hypothetical protein